METSLDPRVSRAMSTIRIWRWGGGGGREVLTSVPGGITGMQQEGSCGNSEGKGNAAGGDLVVTVRAKGIRSEKSVDQSQFKVWR